MAAAPTARAARPPARRSMLTAAVTTAIARRSITPTTSRLFQLAEARIQKIDPKTGCVLATIPAPGGGRDSGLTWAEGSLWVGEYRQRKIHQIDPESDAILRTIESDRFVTGVTWVDGDLWHGSWQGEESDVRRIDPRTGETLEALEMPPGVGVSGLESDGADRLFCG
jgi:streptogramin lyase